VQDVHGEFKYGIAMAKTIFNKKPYRALLDVVEMPNNMH
jgi:hypothetical protein